MTAIVLGMIGSTIGASIGGTVLGVSASAIGGFIGAGVGAVVDSWIIGQLMSGTQRVEGARLDSAQITNSGEGAAVPLMFGRMRIGGNVIWATDFREEIHTWTEKVGSGSGTDQEIEITEYRYYASFAVALCEGPITGIGRIWADGDLLDLEGITWRWYPGSERQQPDAFVQAKTGPETPAYRGIAYVVFEEMLLTKFGNRIPQMTFEVFRALDDPDTAEGATKAVNIIPSAGEFIYSTQKVTLNVGDGVTVPENVHADSGTPDFRVSLDRLLAACPGIESVSLVVAWFGSDLRVGECEVRPKVEAQDRNTSIEWSVDGVTRAEAQVISQIDGRPAFGGTPADFSVIEAIQECKARGLRVTFYPFIMMDIPPDNDLPDPYSDNASQTGQPVFPWRGRITCSPAPGYDGSVDKSAAATSQVNTFFTRTWGFRRFILHYANLCAEAGGVDAFIIGTEMRGLTQIRGANGGYPAVQRLVDLAEDVRAILGGSTKLSYSADWSEYFGHHPQDGSGDVFFHLDPLWSSPEIDFVGIDNYMPLSDWRDGFEHADALAFDSIYQREYLQSNIEGGEGFDWYYASNSDRAEQLRTPITDGAHGKPWVFRYKDMRSWWSKRHFNRPGGVESGTPTGWVPESKPIRLTEFGCPAVDRGTNQPNVFYDPKSSESYVPYFSRGWRDDTIQRAYIEAVLLYWRDPEHNPVSEVYGGRMIDVDECAVWTWDARPYPWFPALENVWADGGNWRLGHWLTGRLGSVSLPALVRYLCARAGLPARRIDVSQLWGALEGYLLTALESPRASIATLAHHFGFDAVETEGKIVFRMRSRRAVASLTLDELVEAEAGGDVIELERGQETELPQALKWTTRRSDEEYDAATVEARRITVEAARVDAAQFPFAVPPEEAERRARRALQELWVSRENAAFRLPPSRIALDPSDVVVLEHDGRRYEYRLAQVNDGVQRAVSAVRQDREVYDMPPGAYRSTSVRQAILFGKPAVAILDVPQLLAELEPHQPLVAAFAEPWPGMLAVYRSQSLDGGFRLLTTLGAPAHMGVTMEDFHAGPTSRFDMANELVVELTSGALESVTDLLLFDGANAFAVESGDGVWEIVQAANAELVAPSTYRLSRLLRGQRGTEDAIAETVAAGARVVVLDGHIAPLPIAVGNIGRPWQWRVGPSSRPHSDDAYLGFEFTPRGRGLYPFSVCHVEQPYLRGRTPGDLTIRWIRRSRDVEADSWGLEMPVIEDLEAYEIDILDGSTVKRTLTSSTTSVVYSSAAQTQDWGALLEPGQSLTIRIAQMSARVGRGVERTFSLQF